MKEYHLNMSFYNKAKIPKSEDEPKTPYNTYWFHSIPRLESQSKTAQREFIKIASFDVANKTYAIRVEARFMDGRVVPIIFDLWDLRTMQTGDPDFPDENRSNLFRKLDEIKKYLIDLDIVLIERQIPLNVKSRNMMCATIDYFGILLRDSPYYPIIYDVCPKLKGRILGAGRLSKPELKQWAVVKAKEILKLNNDEWSLKRLDGHKKKDDLADTIVQLEAFLIYIKSPLITKGLY